MVQKGGEFWRMGRKKIKLDMDLIRKK